MIDSWEDSGEPWEPGVPDEIPSLDDRHDCDADGHQFDDDGECRCGASA